MGKFGGCSMLTHIDYAAIGDKFESEYEIRKEFDIAMANNIELGVNTLNYGGGRGAVCCGKSFYS